ncbi:hypothetical protein [Klebsiella grimontii]|uniref:hypothetical protein n=1 Tax=Klebsiella grimontii TaxID=2058152 RepID=UPI001CCD5C3A|nr:hypothetical protein [Klebsiella grimontii]MBZ7566766.1 hypothetical protein [Klebsiella grimontii]MDU2495756.1 hypothetical protein [Klebsiella grimontii]MDU3810539.1 hypothetical protein [Klebsiella grimontii]
MLKLHLALNIIGALLIASSDQNVNDAGGLIFGIMVILVAAIIIVSEAYRSTNAVTYKIRVKVEGY